MMTHACPKLNAHEDKIDYEHLTYMDLKVDKELLHSFS